MTAQEALERWEVHGDGPYLPQIYRDMGLTRLRILVAEEAKPNPLRVIDRMPIPRLNYNPLDRALGRETPPAPAPAAPAAKGEAPPPAPKTLRDRALTNPARLRTPGRKRASFRYHLSVCGSVSEAAARAQVSCSTLYHWRDTLPGFAALWDKAIAQCQRAVGDDIVLQAGQVGQGRRINAQLLMHVQKRLDADRRRAEDRTERRELALLRGKPLDEEALAERLLVLMDRRRETSHSVSNNPDLETPDSPSNDKDLDKAA
ncbi:MAG: hypothetical protein ACT4O6_13365 [Reyranella sp.]